MLRVYELFVGIGSTLWFMYDITQERFAFVDRIVCDDRYSDVRTYYVFAALRWKSLAFRCSMYCRMQNNSYVDYK